MQHCQRSLDLSRETGSRALTADTLATLGFVHLSLGDYGMAVACYMEVLVIYREIGDKGGTAEALTGLGDAQHARGDIRTARPGVITLNRCPSPVSALTTVWNAGTAIVSSTWSK